MQIVEIKMSAGSSVLIQLNPNQYGQYSTDEAQKAFIKELEPLFPNNTKILITEMPIASLAIICPARKKSQRAEEA